MRSAIYTAIALCFAYLVWTSPNVTEGFSVVPYNSFGDPPWDTMKEKDVQEVADKFTNMIATANGTDFAVAYHMTGLKDALETILNSLGFGKYNVVSIGDTTPFTMNNVTIQHAGNLSLARLERVDFIVTSSVPFVISKVLITPDMTFNALRAPSGFSGRADEMGNVFQLKNPLHLFYPYRTSDNDMAITAAEQQEFNAIVHQKATDGLGGGVTVALPYAPVPNASEPSAPALMLVSDVDGETTLRQSAYSVR